MVGLLPPGPAADAAVVVVTDVTSRERRERAEREFVMNAAHELRTPLSAISSAVEVLQQGAKENDVDRDRFLAIVERQTTRLTRLVRSLLTLARAQTSSEAIRLEAVPVAPLVQELAAGFDDPSVRIDVCCDDVTVIAHADLLRQALDNLTANALKHAAGQGLTLRVAHVPGGRVRIEVADRGPGMTREDAEKALDRFYRARGSDGEGFGLGLSIAREVVRVMDGTLTIDSQLGKGTTVSLELESTDDGEQCR
jgi:signal transduction histidine kinase